jgi:hypothetical protein
MYAHQRASLQATVFTRHFRRLQDSGVYLDDFQGAHAEAKRMTDLELAGQAEEVRSIQATHPAIEGAGHQATTDSHRNLQPSPARVSQTASVVDWDATFGRTPKQADIGWDDAVAEVNSRMSPNVPRPPDFWDEAFGQRTTGNRAADASGWAVAVAAVNAREPGSDEFWDEAFGKHRDGAAAKSDEFGWGRDHCGAERPATPLPPIRSQ